MNPQYYVCQKHSFSFTSAKPCQYCESPAPSAQVKCDCSRSNALHEKDCEIFRHTLRSAVPKASPAAEAPKAREFWMYESSTESTPCFAYNYKPNFFGDIIHVTELRPGEIVVSREQALNAYHKATSWHVYEEILLKLLGFPESEASPDKGAGGENE